MQADMILDLQAELFQKLTDKVYIYNVRQPDTDKIHEIVNLSLDYLAAERLANSEIVNNAPPPF